MNILKDIKEIIINQKIPVITNNIFYLVILFGIFCFISGLIGGYVLNTYLIYNSLYELINNNGILIFDDKYYRFIEIDINNMYGNYD